MPLYCLPHRSYRPLLLPPGWVALGLLLLLGCLALQAHWRQLRLVNVLQITMPPLKADTAILTFYRVNGVKRDTADYNPYIDAGAKNALVKINRMRPWHTVNFGGQPLADFFNAQVIESTILAISADSGRAGGVRIQFRAGATYANLTKVLDIMNAVMKMPPSPRPFSSAFGRVLDACLSFALAAAPCSRGVDHI